MTRSFAQRVETHPGNASLGAKKGRFIPRAGRRQSRALGPRDSGTLLKERENDVNGT